MTNRHRIVHGRDDGPVRWLDEPPMIQTPEQRARRAAAFRVDEEAARLAEERGSSGEDGSDIDRDA